MLEPKTAKEIMVTQLVTLSPDQHVYDGIAGLLKNNITGAPVIDSQHNYLGVFSEKCCMNVLNVMATNACEDESNAADSIPVETFMTQKLVSLSPDEDAFDAIEKLLNNRISGAPVLDDQGTFLGVFSEKDSMRALISAAYEQLPSTSVGALMNTRRQRVIAPGTDLLSIAKMFVETPLRRLAVVDENEKLVGQVSRRDVLRAEQKCFKSVRHRVKGLADQMKIESTVDSIAESETNASGEFYSEADAYTDAETNRVAYFMDRNAMVIPESTGFWGVAQVFLDTPYRRLPVVENGVLVGQISRRDLLRAANELFPRHGLPEKSLLYLSSIVDRQDAPIS